jgi:hypothetical protein
LRFPPPTPPGVRVRTRRFGQLRRRLLRAFGWAVGHGIAGKDRNTRTSPWGFTPTSSCVAPERVRLFFRNRNPITYWPLLPFGPSPSHHGLLANTGCFCPFGSVSRSTVRASATMPSADFCLAIRKPYGFLSPEFETPSRPPEVSLTAFHAQPPNLRFAPLMEMDFAVIGQLVRRLRLISGFCPSARVFAPRFLQTPPRGDALALR